MLFHENGHRRLHKAVPRCRSAAGAEHVVSPLQAAPVLTRLIVDFWQDPVGAVRRHTDTPRGQYRADPPGYG